MALATDPFPLGASHAHRMTTGSLAGSVLSLPIDAIPCQACAPRRSSTHFIDETQNQPCQPLGLHCALGPSPWAFATGRINTDSHKARQRRSLSCQRSTVTRHAPHLLTVRERREPLGLRCLCCVMRWRFAVSRLPLVLKDTRHLTRTPTIRQCEHKRSHCTPRSCSKDQRWVCTQNA